MFTVKQIFKESIPVLLIASVLSLVAGLFLRNIEQSLLVIVPLIIVLPALNDMIGDFGIVITSRFTTILYEKKLKGRWYHSGIIRHLFRDIMPISIFSGLYIAVIATFIANTRGYTFDILTLWKIVGITLATTITLVIFEFIVAIMGGIYVYKRKMNPDDVLIPIITSVADLASIIIFSLLVMLLF